MYDKSLNVSCEARKAVKSVSGRGFAPELAWGACDTPPDHLVRCRWGILYTIKCYDFSIDKNVFSQDVSLNVSTTGIL